MCKYVGILWSVLAAIVGWIAVAFLVADVARQLGLL